MIDKRILLVEDEYLTRNLIKEKLLANKFNVIDHQDGKAALEAYRANPFPVVITDIDMPVMDGNELIAQLK
jgi:CheY-like chemotaxis protein